MGAKAPRFRRKLEWRSGGEFRDRVGKAAWGAKVGDGAAVDMGAGARVAAASRERDAEVVLGGVDWAC